MAPADEKPKAAARRLRILRFRQDAAAAGDDGIRRVYLKKPGPFTVVLILLAAGAVAALFFLLLAGLMLLWIPLIIAGILFAVFSISARDLWGRVQGWFGGRRAD